MGPKTIYTGRKFRLELCFGADPVGAPREYEVIRHPGAAVILPLLADGRIVMIQNDRPAVSRTLLELPAGTIDPPESPEVCAARELTEETGYAAAMLEPLASFYSTPGICDERMYVFLAQGLTPGTARLEPGEKIATIPMEYSDVLASIEAGRVIDAKTLVAVLYYDRFRRCSGGAAGAD